MTPEDITRLVNEMIREVRRRAPIEPIALSEAEAARILSVSTRTLYQWRIESEIPYARCGGRILYNVAALREWLASKTQPAR